MDTTENGRISEYPYGFLSTSESEFPHPIAVVLGRAQLHGAIACQAARDQEFSDPQLVATLKNVEFDL